MKAKVRTFQIVVETLQRQNCRRFTEKLIDFPKWDVFPYTGFVISGGAEIFRGGGNIAPRDFTAAKPGNEAVVIIHTQDQNGIRRCFGRDFHRAPNRNR